MNIHFQTFYVEFYYIQVWRSVDPYGRKNGVIIIRIIAAIYIYMIAHDSNYSVHDSTLFAHYSGPKYFSIGER